MLFFMFYQKRTLLKTRDLKLENKSSERMKSEPIDCRCFINILPGIGGVDNIFEV